MTTLSVGVCFPPLAPKADEAESTQACPGGLMWRCLKTAWNPSDTGGLSYGIRLRFQTPLPECGCTLSVLQSIENEKWVE